MVQHDQDGEEHHIFYISRTLIYCEIRYTTIEKQCLALVFACQKLGHYLLNAEVHFYVKSNSLNISFQKWIYRDTLLNGSYS